VAVEAFSMRDIASTMILPVAMQFQRQIAESIAAVTAVHAQADVKSQRELSQVTDAIQRLRGAVADLNRARHAAEETKAGANDVAAAFRDRVIPLMNQVREQVDVLEGLVDDQLWPLPKYRELLFLH
jgi:glutamine synthetase